MSNCIKKTLAALLTLCMVCTMLPAEAVGTALASTSGVELNVSELNLAPNGYATITAQANTSTYTLTWSSSDTSIATVAKTGAATSRVTAVKSGTATITATLSNGSTATCTVYVSITNGVYFIGSGSLYLSVDGGMLEGSTVTLQVKKPSGPAQLRQLWKIERIGQHYYSIRSMYRPDLVLYGNDDGTVSMTYLNPSQTGSNIPMSKRWEILRDGTGYLFHYAGTASMALHPENGALSAGNDVVVGFNANSTFPWKLEWGPDIEDQVLLINTTNGLPATGAVRYITAGGSVSRSSLNLNAVFVSWNTNAQNITWTSSTPSVATVGDVSGNVRGVWEGQTTITASNSSSTISQSYTIKVSPIPQGTYFIRNCEYGKYLQIEDDDSSNNYSTSGAIMEQWAYSGEDYQKWNITPVGNGYYSIISVKSGLALSVPAGQTGTTDVTLVQQAYQGLDRQKWIITQTADYQYKIKPKSSEGLSNDFVMAVGTYTEYELYGQSIQQRNYINDNNKRDVWQICSFVDIGMSTDNYTNDENDRERGSYRYATDFYDNLLPYPGMPVSKTHHYNKDSTFTASKADFAVNGAMSNDIDFMIYMGHGHSAHRDETENNHLANHIQYSHSTTGATNVDDMCTSLYSQEYKDAFCLYSDEVYFGSAYSDLRWVWMYTCNFLHAKEDNNDNDGDYNNDNDHVTNAMLAARMRGVHMVMGYASSATLCSDVSYDFAEYLRDGMPFYDAFFLYGFTAETEHAKNNHYQKIMYIPQARYENIYSPKIHYVYSSSDVIIEKRNIFTEFTGY